jgi:hypothetical protein
MAAALCFPPLSASPPLVAIEATYEINWTESLCKRYPELLWLKQEGVEVAAEGNKVASNLDEFHRTLMGIKCFEMIANGSEEAYEQFTSKQNPSVKLRWESFVELHEMVPPPEFKELIVTSLVLGDLAKSPYSREQLKPYGVEDPDQDDFYDHMVKVLQDHPGISSSFQCLSKDQQEYLAYISGLGHMGHMTHLEDGKRMFTSLKNSQVAKATDTQAFRIAFFIHLCDGAGALGHIDQESSLVFTQETFEGLQTVREACELIVKEGVTEETAYHYCLQKRGEKIGLLRFEDPVDRFLIHIACFSRLYRKELGEVLREGMEKCPKKEDIMTTVRDKKIN